MDCRWQRLSLVCVRKKSEGRLGCSVREVACLSASPLPSLLPLFYLLSSLVYFAVSPAMDWMTVELTNNQASVLSNFCAAKRERLVWWAVHVVDPDLLLLHGNVHSSDLSLAISVNSDLFCRHVVLCQKLVHYLCVSPLSPLGMSGNPLQWTQDFLVGCVSCMQALSVSSLCLLSLKGNFYFYWRSLRYSTAIRSMI